MTDQQRADLRKAEGFPLDTMPNLDALAEQGADFRHAYTTMPVCAPARVSLLTGRYPSATRVRTNHNIEDAVFERDLVGVLQEAGYATALVGKNHSHLQPEDMDYWVQFGHGGQAGGERTSEEEEFDNYLTDLRHRTDLDPTPFPPEYQNPYRIVTKATEWIDSVGDEPFFLWMSFPEPHNPFQVSEPYYSMFPPESLPPLDSGKEDAVGKGFKYRFMRQQWEALIPDFDAVVQRTRANYLGMLTLIDDQLGRFLEFLDDTGRREDTIVVFTSDHGDFWGEYGLIRKGPDLPEVLCRIPLVVAGPGVQAGRTTDAHVSLADLMPTVCDAVDVPLPRGVQGRSLWPLLTSGADVAADPSAGAGPNQQWESAYVEHGFGGAYYTDTDDLDLSVEGALNDGCTLDELNSWTQSGTARMVRRDRYKLIYDMEGTGQLYDLATDPAELQNRYGDSDLTQVRHELLQELLRWTLKTEDPLPHPRRRYYFKDSRTGELEPPTDA
jgi:arylsulfatase A-like enzyme